LIPKLAPATDRGSATLGSPANESHEDRAESAALRGVCVVLAGDHRRAPPHGPTRL